MWRGPGNRRIFILIWLIVYSPNLIYRNKAVLVPGGDCRSLSTERTKVSFVRVSSTSYRCMPTQSNRIHSCYSGYHIPPWYFTSPTDPCVCSSYVDRNLRTRILCPRRPTYVPQFAPPRENAMVIFARRLPINTVMDSGCPAPFLKFAGMKKATTLNSYMFSTAVGIAMHSPEETCKLQCLLHGTCQAVQYNKLTGICRGFTRRGTEKSRMKSALSNLYYKLECGANNGAGDGIGTTPSPPTTTVSPIFSDVLDQGEIFTDQQQSGGVEERQLRGADQQSCFAFCGFHPSCQAADYNKYAQQCWIHVTATCSSHRAAPDKCCNHYKKMHC